MYLLGIDVGTTLIKTIVSDEEGNVVSSAEREVGVEHQKAGWAEQDAELLWKTTSESIKLALSKKGIEPGSIAGISVTGQMNCSFLIDKHGEPVRKGIIWLDSREEKEKVLRRWDEDGTSELIYKKTGHAPMACLQLLHMWWLAKNEPETLRKARIHLGCKDWIRYKLTGDEGFMDHTEASVTGLFDPVKKEWDEEILQLIGVDSSIFKPTKGSQECAGEVTAEASKETGLKKGTPVAVGAGDVCATALGAGCTEEGQGIAIIGTAGIYALTTNRPMFDPKRNWGVNCHALKDKYLLLAPSLTAGSTLKWFRDAMIPECEREKVESDGKRIYSYLDDLAAKVPPGANGLMFWPFFNGERSPINKPTARGSFMGLTLWTKREDMIRAILEGAAYSAKDNFSLFEEVQIKEIRISGGGKKSDLWCSIFADVLGYPLSITSSEEGGAMGSIILAGCASKIFDNATVGAKRIVKVEKVIEPNKENNSKYTKLFKLYRSFYTDLWDWYDNFTGTYTNEIYGGVEGEENE